MLDTTVESVTSALKRARAGLQRQQSLAGQREPAPVPDSPSEHALVAEFVRAYEAADLDAVVALLTDDVFMSMPPMPFEYEGRELVARFCANILQPGRRFDLVVTGPTVNLPSGPTSVPMPAAVAAPGSSCSPSPAIGSPRLIRFERTVLPWFGLPAALPADPLPSGPGEVQVDGPRPSS